VKAAQRAFFDAALAGEAQDQAAPAAVAKAQPPAVSPAARLRPGSIVDIKV
jgi:hypothetical protein